MTSVDRRVEPQAPGTAIILATDIQLARALCARELAALEEAVRRHGRRVADAAGRIAGADHVDDVVQEVFLALWRAPEKFQPGRGSLATYLLTLTRGRAIDVLRSEGARQRRQHEHGSHARPSEPVEELVMTRTSAAELRLALRVLPMTERVAIELAYFGGDTYRQVAAKLGEPEGTIKSRIRSGLRRLQLALSEIGAIEV